MSARDANAFMKRALMKRAPDDRVRALRRRSMGISGCKGEPCPSDGVIMSDDSPTTDWIVREEFGSSTMYGKRYIVKDSAMSKDIHHTI